MTLLWDGTFHGNESTTGQADFYNPSGAYNTYAALCYPNAFAVVNANTLPGGRTGYAGKFYNGVGAECHSERHDLVIGSYRGLSAAHVNEFWFGWSQYLAAPWLNGGSAGVYVLGAGLTTMSEAPGVIAGKGFSMVNWCCDWRVWGSASGDQTLILTENMENKWYDFMFHIKLTTDSTGFFEIYVKRPGDSDYSMILGKYNFVSQYPQPIDPNALYYQIAIGQYGSSSATNPSTIYILNPRIGTTQADVRYGVAPTCPQLIHL